MTTDASDYQIALAPNLFEPNECVNLPKVLDAEVSAGLACISVLRSGHSQQHGDLIWACLRYARDSTLSILPLMTCSLYACVCGEDTRIFRHRGLWKTLAAQDFQAAEQPTQEMLVKNSDGTLCIYGATAVADEQINRCRPVVRPVSRSFLALLPIGQPPAVELVVAAGWKRGLSDLGELRNVALSISKQGGIIVRMFGEFNDMEAGVDCIMSPSTYERVIASLLNIQRHNPRG